MSAKLSRRKIEAAFELSREMSRSSEDAKMIGDAVEAASEIADVDPQGAQDVLREHLPPWLRRDAESILF